MASKKIDEFIKFVCERYKSHGISEEVKRLMDAREKLYAKKEVMSAEEFIERVADMISERVLEKLFDKAGDEEEEDDCEGCPYADECGSDADDSDDEEVDDSDAEDEADTHVIRIKAETGDDGELSVTSIFVDGEKVVIDTDDEDLVEGDEPPKK